MGWWPHTGGQHSCLHQSSVDNSHPSGRHRQGIAHRPPRAAMAYQEILKRAIVTGKLYDDLPTRIKMVLTPQDWKQKWVGSGRGRGGRKRGAYAPTRAPQHHVRHCQHMPPLHLPCSIDWPHCPTAKLPADTRRAAARVPRRRNSNAAACGTSLDQSTASHPSCCTASSNRVRRRRCCPMLHTHVPLAAG